MLKRRFLKIRGLDISTFITENEAQQLMKLATNRTYLEIGAYDGFSTFCALRTAKKVVSIDFKLRPALYNNRELFDRIVFIKGRSEHVTDFIADSSVDMLFIDGAHDENSVLRDLRNYISKLQPDGILALHDTNMRSVRNAINKTLNYDDLQIVDTLGWIIKDENLYWKK